MLHSLGQEDQNEVHYLFGHEIPLAQALASMILIVSSVATLPSLHQED